MAKSERGQATVIGATRIEVRGGTVTNAKTQQKLVVGTLPQVIGRSACDLRLEDLAVSAAHCEVLATPLGVRLRDLGSRNGTFVNGVRVVEAFVSGAAEIKLGGTVLEFRPGKTTPHVLPATFGHLESVSGRMQAVFEQLAAVARTSLNVHLTGESGTGKGYIAKQIHAESRRSRMPFITIDLGRIPPNLIESALFGHERGAFSGATTATVSPFVEADGGTVFLDEIGELSREHQTRLLRVVDEKVVQRVGSTREQKVDVRIISATLHDLRERVNRKKFRDDLFYRLGSRIELPPLRARLEDMDLLVRQILRDLGRPELFDLISNRTLEWMTEQPWPGNLRTLRHVLETAAQLQGDERSIDVEKAFRIANWMEPPEAPELALATLAEKSPVDALIGARATSVEVERAARGMLLKSLHVECEGNVSEIARRADLSRKVVRTELALLGARQPMKPWKRLTRRKTG